MSIRDERDIPIALAALIPATLFTGIGVVYVHCFITDPHWFSAFGSVVSAAVVIFSIRLAWRWAHGR